MQQSRSINLLPMTQRWAWDLSYDMLHNFWLPNQIATGLDKQDLAKLSADEIHLFKNALAYLTTSDIQIGDNAQDGIDSAIKSLGVDFEPVLRFPQGVQICQERVHAISYQEILETILSLSQDEQRELYEIWQNVPEMRAKIEFAAEMNQTLLNSFPTVETEAALWWWYNIYEGCWFMNGFNPIFALSRSRSVFKNVVEQLKYIMRDETTHVTYGQQLFQLSRQLHKSSGYHSEFDSLIDDLVQRSNHLELDWIKFLLPRPILGYSAEIHMGHFRHLINLRMKQTGMLQFYKFHAPIPWLSEYQLRNEANFFERHPTEYQTGATLNWD